MEINVIHYACCRWRWKAAWLQLWCVWTVCCWVEPLHLDIQWLCGRPAGCGPPENISDCLLEMTLNICKWNGHPGHAWLFNIPILCALGYLLIRSWKCHGHNSEWLLFFKIFMSSNSSPLIYHSHSNTYDLDFRFASVNSLSLYLSEKMMQLAFQKKQKWNRNCIDWRTEVKDFTAPPTVFDWQVIKDRNSTEISS